MKPNIHLDIDGVLLANDLHAANYSKESLNHILKTIQIQHIG